MVVYWMALGLTESTEMNGSIEEIGTRYFNQLLARSFFEVVPVTQFAQKCQTASVNIDPTSISLFENLVDWSTVLELFQMHDLLYDLGRYVSWKETAFVSFDKHQVSARIQHIVWTEDNCFEREFPCQLLTANKARSLRFDNKKGGHMSTSFLKNLISNFRCLAGFEFEELPNSIGESKHLRYLSLKRNGKLKRLPDSISKLVNLQTLDVSQCKQLQLFPRNLHKWISLRHLYFTSKLDTCLETSYHGWTSIWKISIVGCADLTSLSEKIGTLTTLRVLSITDCPNLASLPNSIQLLTAVERLNIESCERLNLSGWEGLNGLTNLRVLIILRLPLLEQFPDGLQHCTSLLKLIITGCHKFSTIPRGIDSLKNLQLLWIVADNPILRSSCEREKGQDWNLISHIPNIHVQ